MKSTEISTINVVDCCDSDSFEITALKAFPSTNEGRQEAEALYIAWIEEAEGRPLTDQEKSDAIDNGRYGIGAGVFALINST